MIRREQIIATTHIDRHRDKMVLSALESLVAGVHEAYIPMIVDHDPRSPPIGRVADARIEQVEDGEYAVIGTWEVYEDGDRVHSDPDRCIPLRSYEIGEIQLRYDRTYRDDQSQEIIANVSEHLGSEPTEEGKKALEPISVLILGAGVALGAIATGFLNALGADSYEFLKDRLKKLCVPQRGERDEQLLRIELAMWIDSQLINVDVIFTNPTDADVEFALDAMLNDLDLHLAGLLPLDPHIRRLVYEVKTRQLELKFGVRSDAIPVTPRRVSLSPPDESGGDWPDEDEGSNGV